MKKPEVIVSLTSWPPAIGFVPAAVRSILSGTVLPDRIILYLTAEQFPDRVLPQEIEELKEASPRFEVRFWNENIRSYTKLVPALHDFPDDIIITIDDDMAYHRRMVESLLRWHRKLPDTIIAHNVRRMLVDREGRLKGYFEWKRYKPIRYLRYFPRPGFQHLLFGLGGVLYPPHSLDEDMLDPKLFMSIAPTVDDVWFWAASVSKGTKVYPVIFGYRNPRALGKPREIALGTGNTRSGVDVNRNVVMEILRRYPLIKQRLEESIGRNVNL
jgi:hypothetical protein